MDKAQIDFWRLILERAKYFALVLVIVGTGFSITLCGLGLGIYLVLLLLQIFFFRKENIESFPYYQLFLAVFASLVISVYVSSYFFISLRGLWKYMEGFFLLYAMIDILRGRRVLRWLIGAYLAVVLFAAWDGIIQDRTGHDLIYQRDLLPYKILEIEPDTDEYVYLISRITGPFKHSNDYATFLLPGFFVFLSFLLYSMKRNKRLWVLFSLLGLGSVGFALVRTLSMGAFVGLFAALVIFCCFFGYRWLILMALGLAGILLISPDLGQRAGEILSMNYQNTEARVILFKTAQRMVQDSPFFGLGLNTYSEHFPQYKPEEYRAAMYAHNAYIQIAAEAGWVGLSLYLAYIGRLVWDFFRRLRKGVSDFRFVFLVGFMAGVAGFLVNCFFDSCLQSTQLRSLFWMLMGAAFVLAQRPENFETAERVS